MLFLNVWNYFRGYVIIAIEGYFVEKFMNICIHRRIFLWDIKKHCNGRVTMKASIKGFKMLRPVARKTKCRVRIVKKIGMPFVKNRYRKRKTFLIGAFAFIVVFFILTSYVWDIEITGNNEIESSFILETLSESGVKPGVLKFGMDTQKIANDLMIKNDNLAWVGVSIKGTKLKIVLDERDLPPKLVSKDDPCNIVAARDAIIEVVVSKAGFDIVKPGDTVVKGQILVTGSVPGRDEKDNITLVHAVSTVKARTWYEASSPVEIKTVEKERTGALKEKKALLLFGKKINLSFGKVSFGNYDKTEVKRTLAIGEDFVLPFEYLVESYYEYIEKEKEIPINDAQQKAIGIANSKAMEQISKEAKIIKKNNKIEKNDEGKEIATVYIECVENIAVSEKIGGN